MVRNRVERSGHEPLGMNGSQWANVAGSVVAALCGLIYYWIVRAMK